MYRILILSEDVEVRSVLFDTLQEFDEEFELYESKKRDEAKRILSNKNIQIVITDFEMKLHELYDGATYVDLIVIGEKEKAGLQTQKLFAANIHYIFKPVLKAELKKSIIEALRNIEVRGMESTNQIHCTPEITISNEKEEFLIEELNNMISLKNGKLLLEKLDMILSIYRETELQYPFYVRSMCMRILHGFLKNMPTKRLEQEKMIEYIFKADDFKKIENLLQTYAELVIDEFENEASSSNRVIYQVKQYIDLHYHEELKLSNLAEQVYLSANYLSNIFTKHTGYSLNKYIKEVRLTKARELLLGTNMKIADVGRRVGYDNTSYFIKKFQEKYGMTPEKYRLKPMEQEETWN